MTITQSAARLNSTVSPNISPSSTATNMNSNLSTSVNDTTNANITSTVTTKVMSNTQPNLKWKLLEMVQVTDDPMDSDVGAPMQWFKFSGTQPEVQEPIVLLAGFNGATKNDNRVLQLLQKALSSGVISSSSDIYLCPIVNPTSSSRKPQLNDNGIDIYNGFPVEGFKNFKQTPEIQSILGWIERIEPKAVITLQTDEASMSHKGVTEEILEKLTALAERPVLELGETLKEEEAEEPTLNALGLPIQTTTMFKMAPEKTQESRDLTGNIGNWCEEKELIWLSLSVDSNKKSFDEIKEDWRLNIGPAMKWLLEAPRFNPPAQEPEVEAPTVVGVLDLPPELMNIF